LAAQECAALWRRRRALQRLSAISWNWHAAAALLVAMDLSIAMAVPISRTVQEDSGRQEAFVENVVAAMPAGASLQAVPNFPETVLMVLAYRLDRRIERQPVNCFSQAYYLTTADLNGCAPGAATIVVSSSDHNLNLLRLPTTSR
jgi:hypothetical protein